MYATPISRLCTPLRCVPCQRLEPIFADAARQLLMETPPIRLGRVQIPDQMKVAERFPLQGYPLLIMFRYGAQYNYTGPKESAAGILCNRFNFFHGYPCTPILITDIVEYMRQQAGPSSILLEQTGDVQRFINQREVSVVGYFHDDTGICDSLITSFGEIASCSVQIPICGLSFWSLGIWSGLT